jgi:general secretion pathway protein C
VIDLTRGTAEQSLLVILAEYRDEARTVFRMLETLMHALLARRLRNAPSLLSLAIAALIAVELARIALTPLGGNAPRSAAPPMERRVQGFNHSRIDIRTIVAVHLFGVAADDPTQDPGNAPPTTANLVLAGTIATEDSKRGVAIINDDGPSKVYTVGDAVGGASLHAVYLDHVILDRSGRLETLALPRPLLAGGSAARPPAQTSRVAAAVDAHSSGHEDSRSLAGVMRVGASMNNEAGKLRGFRIYPGRNPAAFNATGLRGGDLVIGVNGTSVPDQDRQLAQEIFDAIKSSATATLTVERFGKTREVAVDLTQVATDASTETPAPPGAAAANE